VTVSDRAHTKSSLSNHEELYHAYAAVPAEPDLPGKCHIKLRLILQ
jgi:hypothetical protein